MKYEVKAWADCKSLQPVLHRLKSAILDRLYTASSQEQRDRTAVKQNMHTVGGATDIWATVGKGIGKGHDTIYGYNRSGR